MVVDHTEFADQIISAVADMGLSGDYNRAKFQNDEPRAYTPEAAATFFDAVAAAAQVLRRHRAAVGGQAFRDLGDQGEPGRCDFGHGAGRGLPQGRGHQPFRGGGGRREAEGQALAIGRDAGISHERIADGVREYLAR